MADSQEEDHMIAARQRAGEDLGAARSHITSASKAALRARGQHHRRHKQPDRQRSTPTMRSCAFGRLEIPYLKPGQLAGARTHSDIVQSFGVDSEALSREVVRDRVVVSNCPELLPRPTACARMFHAPKCC